MHERTFIGLDVHARSVKAGVLDGLTGEVSSLAVPVATKALVAWVCAQPAPAVAYEAGPTGYELARALHAAGVRCLVAAPSRVPRAPGDRVKTDRRDAVRLARLLRLEELVAVRVPSLAEEAARDLVRAREDARGDLMRARHRLSKLLLRRGIVWEERAWTQAHELWLSRQRFCERPLQVAYEEALAAMVAVRDRRDALDAAIAVEAATEPWAPVVARLTCLRGVSTLTSCCAPGPRHRLLCARSRKMPPQKRCPCPCCGASVTTRIRRAGRESTSNGEDVAHDRGRQGLRLRPRGGGYQYRCPHPWPARAGCVRPGFGSRAALRPQPVPAPQAGSIFGERRPRQANGLLHLSPRVDEWDKQDLHRAFKAVNHLQGLLRFHFLL